MLFVRPSRLADLDALEHMARTAQPVLHSLPHDRSALETRVALSEDSFRADVDFPGEEFYLFVLEDAQSGKLMGTASIVAAAAAPSGRLIATPQMTIARQISQTRIIRPAKFSFSAVRASS